MTTHEPNLDMLTAYADGLLSPDAERSMRQHLESCELCTCALEAEREMLSALDAMRAEPLPDDFVAAVMGRVAQYPAHRPAAPIPWREIARWGAAASVAGGVVGLAAIAWIFGSGLIQGSELVAAVIGQGASLITGAVRGGRELSTWLGVLLQEGGELLWRLARIAVNSGWLVQVTLLVITVSLNYAFTRLVVNYQRRH